MADGKHQLTKAYMLFLARWARKLSWKETAESFHTSWDKVCDAVEYVVKWGLEHRTLAPIRAIGVDEIQYAKGHKYLTLVYQIDAGLTRLLWVGKERTIESFEGFFTLIGKELASPTAAERVGCMIIQGRVRWPNTSNLLMRAGDSRRAKDRRGRWAPNQRRPGSLCVCAVLTPCSVILGNGSVLYESHSRLVRDSDRRWHFGVQPGGPM